MKKKNFFILILLLTLFFTTKNVYAYNVDNYRYRDLCGNYEVAGFHSDGVIDTVKCFNNFNDAQRFMKENGANDLAIMTKVNGETKIIDANMALLDLSVNPTTLTYFYENSELTSRQYTYMDTGSLYGGVDGGLLDVSYSNAKGKWTAKVRTGNFTGWIPSEAYEIVPITWIKSYSNYVVSNESIRHNYVTKIQNDYRSSGGSTIGPKPEMLKEGTYYSYDGHYFYDTLEKLIKDYKNNTYQNSVNKDNPYYNYYMYLSNHTRTAYSSINIDEYIRNNLGYKKDVYGHKASDGTSRLYGSGTFFYYAQEKYGVNAILSLSLSRNETGNGRSYLAINKNNGFGLNAVDSNPIGGANWYATFGNSILGYASKWITYGFAKATDWRYFGPQFGDKWIGMNVKYASDTYWSEKMASNYYHMDKALGLQDYNYYQLGVLKQPAAAYREPSTSSKFIYEYPEAEDAVVIIDEVTKNNEKWYKVMSDLNTDQNYNEITSGDYNWDNAVYVKAEYIKKINKGKNGYISPNEVIEYQNKDYEYNLYIENGEFHPRVGISTKDTKYYYDSSLTSETGNTLLKDRYVIIYAKATLDNQPIAYLVTSDYFYSQKEWVSASDIKQTEIPYGKVTVDTDSNQYTWVNYNTEDEAYSKIGGLYTYSYVPVLSTQKVGNDIWYKVPVSLTTNENVYGYTLAKYSNYISIELSTPIVENTSPVINAVDKTIIEGEEFKEKEGVSANDSEDGDLTDKIEVASNKVNIKVPGIYDVIYKVTDSTNNTTTKTIKVTVKENKAPEITAEDKTITVNQEFKELKHVTANDSEDGDLTNKIKVKTNTVDTTKEGFYKVIYEVEDSHKKKATKEIKVEVVKDQKPEIIAENKILFRNQEFDPLENVEAKDYEDGMITAQIKIIKNTVDITKKGNYQITYQVTDSSKNTIEKTITVEVKEEREEEDGEFYLEGLEWDKTKKKYIISGYLIILNQDNKNKEYSLVLKDKNNSEKEIEIKINNWIENTPYDLGTENNHSYTESWYKGEIDFSKVENGDYDLYMSAYSNGYYTRELVDNFFNQKITKRAEDETHGYNFKVLSNLKTQQMELEVRDKLYTTSEAPTYRNMINEFENIEFKNNQLWIEGYSYNYNGVYNAPLSITRKLILENTKTYEQIEYDLGSKTGPYTLNTKDKLDKTYAWYEKGIDLSKLDKGTYKVLVYTKTSNAEDYGELSDMFRELKETTTINNKKYTITYNKERQDRVEITIE